jgi:ABC-type polar amino acid transport system ATPase subunit
MVLVRGLVILLLALVLAPAAFAPKCPTVSSGKLTVGTAAGGMTMLIVTHEMAFARDIADRGCFLDGGVILEQGPPAQIFSAPREPRTQQFLERIVAAGRM